MQDAGTSVALLGGKMQWNNTVEGLALVTEYPGVSASSYLDIFCIEIGFYLIGMH